MNSAEQTVPVRSSLKSFRVCTGGMHGVIVASGLANRDKNIPFRFCVFSQPDHAQKQSKR